MTLPRFLLAAALAVAAAGAAAAPASPHTAHDLLAAIQAEKLVRMKAGMAHYPNEAARAAVDAKITKVPAETIYTRLAAPVAKLVDEATAAEMARFFQSSYGKKLVYAKYNSSASLYGSEPQPTAAEAAELKRPALVRARAAYAQAEPAIEHEAFVLVTQLANGK
ncbi:MAG: hypothetical protein ACXWKJ_19200 [Telluria sp.]